MKRKLIAVALACALVFSMIPSLAFAHADDEEAVKVTKVADVPTAAKLMDMADAIQAFEDASEFGDDFTTMKLDDNYKALSDKISEAEYALNVLRKSKGADGTSGTAAENKAYTEYAAITTISADCTYLEGEEASGNKAMENSARVAYNTKMDALVEAAIDKIDAKSWKLTENPGLTTEVPALVDAVLTMVAPNAKVASGDTNGEQFTLTKIGTDIDGYASLVTAEKDIFDAVIEKEFAGCYDYDYDKAEAKAKAAASAEAIEKVEAALPRLGSPSAKGDAVYKAVIKYTNDAALNDWGTAMGLLQSETAKNSGKYYEDADIVTYIKDARAAYAKIVGNASLSPALSALQTIETDYVEQLITAIDAESGNYDGDATTGVEQVEDVNSAVIAAANKARAAYDELMEFDKKAGETHDVTNISSLEAIEGFIQTYYLNTLNSAAANVKEIKEAKDVTAANKSKVEVFINAYDNYVGTMTPEEKAKWEAAAANKAIVAQYKALKEGLDALNKAEADADAATKAELEALKAELEALKKNEEANAAEIAALQAKIKFMESKATGVKVKVGKKKATISWKKVDGAAKYKVYRATSKNGKFKAVKTTAKVKFTNKKLKSGKNYFYKVVAVYGDGALSKDSKIVKSKKIK